MSHSFTRSSLVVLGASVLLLLLVSPSGAAQDGDEQLTISNPQTGDLVGENKEVDVYWNYSGFDAYTGATGQRNCEITFEWKDRDNQTQTSQETKQCDEGNDNSPPKHFKWSAPDSESYELTINVSLTDDDGDPLDDTTDSDQEASGNTASHEVVVDFDAQDPTVRAPNYPNFQPDPSPLLSAEAHPDQWISDASRSSLVVNTNISDLFLQGPSDASPPQLLWDSWSSADDLCTSSNSVDLTNTGSGNLADGFVFETDLYDLGGGTAFADTGDQIAYAFRASDDFRSIDEPSGCATSVYGVGIDAEDPTFTKEIEVTSSGKTPEDITWYSGNVDFSVGLDSTGSAFDYIAWKHNVGGASLQEFSNQSSGTEKDTFSVTADTTNWNDGLQFVSVDIKDLAGHRKQSTGSTVVGTSTDVNTSLHIDNQPPFVDTDSSIYFDDVPTGENPPGEDEKVFTFPVKDDGAGVSELDNLQACLNDDNDPDTSGSSGCDPISIGSDAGDELQVTRVDNDHVNLVYRNASGDEHGTLDPGHEYTFEFSNVDDKVQNSASSITRTVYIDQVAPEVDDFRVWVSDQFHHQNTSEDHITQNDDGTFWARDPSAPSDGEFNISVEAHDPDPDANDDGPQGESDMAGLKEVEFFNGTSLLDTVASQTGRTSDVEEIMLDRPDKDNGVTGPLVLNAKVYDDARAPHTTSTDPFTFGVDNEAPESPSIFPEDTHATSGTPSIDFRLDDHGSGPDPSTITISRKNPDSSFFNSVDVDSTHWENETLSETGTLVATYVPDEEPLRNTSGTPYEFRVSFEDNVSASSVTETHEVTVDWSPVVNDTTTLASKQDVEQDRTLTIQLTGYDNTNIQNVTAKFLDNETLNPVAAVDNPHTWNHTRTVGEHSVEDRRITFDLGTGGQVPLGIYKLRLEVRDDAGGVTILDLPREGEGNISVLPQTHFQDPPERESGELNTTVLSRIFNDRAVNNVADDDTSCVRDQIIRCPSFVRLEGKAKSGSDEAWVEFDQIGTSDLEVVQHNGEPWFEFPFRVNLTDAFADSGFTVDDFTNIVRIRAVAELKTGESFERIREKPVGGEGGGFMQIREPSGVNATGNTTYQVELLSLPNGLHGSDAQIQVKVTNITKKENTTAFDWVDLSPPTDTTNNTGIWILNVSEVDSAWEGSFNDTNSFGHRILKSGAYRTDARLLNDTDGFEHAKTDKFTPVQRQQPGVEITNDDPDHPTWFEVGDINWVSRTIQLDGEVNTSFARLTTLDKLEMNFLTGDSAHTQDVDWSRSLSEAKRNGTRFVNHYDVRGEVVVPSIFGDGDSFSLRLDARDNADIVGKDGKQGREGVSPLVGVRLDGSAPEIEPQEEPSQIFNLDDVNASIAQDALRVEVTDQGVQLDASDDPVNFTFFRRDAGTLQFWDTRDNGQLWTDVGDNDPTSITASLVEDSTWEVDASAAAAGSTDVYTYMDDNPTGNFSVAVNATDQVGNLNATNLTGVAADQGPAAIQNLHNVTTDEDLAYDGEITYNATIIEDRWPDHAPTADELELVVRYPNGTVRRHNATSFADVPKSSVDFNQSEQDELVFGNVNDGHVWNVTWTLSGRSELGAVGTYDVGVRVTDPVGTVNRTDLGIETFEVVDTIAPTDLETSLFPGPGRIGASTDVEASISAFDDSGIRNSSITWLNTTGNETTAHTTTDVTSCTFGDDDRTANCTSSSSEAGVDFAVGDTWQVRWVVFDVEDKASRTTSVEFEVLEEVPPAMKRRFDSEFVGPDRGLVLEVREPDLSSNPETNFEIRSRLGNDSFTAYPADNFTVTEESDGVYRANIFPPDADEGAEWEIQVNVTDEIGLSTNKTFSATIDATDPSLNVDISPQAGSNPTYVRSSSEWTVDASDTGSGIAATQYQVDDGSFQSAGDSFTLGDDASGQVTVTVRATDNAGNNATEQRTVLVDGGPPSVTVTDLSRTVNATVTDVDAGVDPGTVTLLFRTSGSSNYDNTEMSNPSGDTWTASVPTNFQGQICVVVEASDLLGATGRSRARDNPQCFGTANQPPTLSITSPADGAEVKNTFQVTWDVSDPNDDQVSIGFEIEAQGSDAPRSLDPVSQSDGQATLDVSGLEDGDYTLTVRANDGAQTAEDTRTITVLNTDVVQTVSVPDARLESSEEITVEVDVSHPTKTVSDVSAIVERNGETVDTVPMENTEGTTYRLEYTPEEPGSYNVSVEVTYADGTSQTFHVSSFTATPAADSAAGIAAQLGALVIMGAVVVGMAVYGAFGRWNA